MRLWSRDFQGLSGIGHKLPGSWKVTYCGTLGSQPSVLRSHQNKCPRLWECRTPCARPPGGTETYFPKIVWKSEK